MRDVAAKLWPFMNRYRFGLAAGLIATMLTNLIRMALPEVLQQAIDYLKSNEITDWVGSVGRGWFGLGQTGGVEESWLLYLAGIFLVISSLSALSMFAMRWLTISTSRRVEYDLRNAFFDHLNKLSTSFFARSRTGDIMSRATNDMDAVRMLLGPAVMYAVNAVVTFAAALIFLLMISPKLTLFALLPFPLLAYTVNYVGKRVHRQFLAIQGKLGDLSAKIQENLAGIRVVKAYVQEPHEVETFRTINDSYVEANSTLIRLEAFFWPMMMTMGGIGFLVVVCYGGLLVIDKTITLGEFVQFNAYLMMLVWPAIAMGWVVNLFQRGSAALGRIWEVLDETPEIADREDANDEPVSQGHIEFRDLSFQYESDEEEPRPVLDNISLDLPAGTTLGIVGPTGSGKSTFISLVSRIFNPPPETLFIDGRDILDISTETLRQSIAVVPQESFLFSDTVEQNVKFGRPDALELELTQVARTAQLEGEIEEFDSGWQTLVGERGITLSGGQKQRVAIARALLCDPAILILDDSFSAVDTHTESKILEGLKKEMTKRTTLVVSHRLSALAGAHQIIYLEDGLIVERGTHEELIALGGRYQSLHARQQLEAELGAA